MKFGRKERGEKVESGPVDSFGRELGKAVHRVENE